MAFGYGYAGKTVSDAAVFTTVGSGVGFAQEILLREYADPAYVKPFLTGTTGMPPPGMKTLKQWAAPSVMTGLIAGGIATGLGVEGLTRGRIIKSANASSFALGYGTTSLLGGILNGVFPSAAISNAVAKDPSNPLTTRVSITPRASASGQQALAQTLIT